MYEGRRKKPEGKPIDPQRRSRPLALVTEDSAETRQILRRLAEQRGFEVVEAVDGEEGVAAAARCLPDLIFLDLHMPRLDGLPALSKIRDNDPNVPVVIISGSTDSETTDRALSLGAVNLIHKPFDRLEIQFVLDRIYKTIEEQASMSDVIDLVERRSTELTFGNESGILSKVVAYLGRELQNGYPGYDVPVTEVKLALYEALANAYEHGNLEITFEEKTAVLMEPGGIAALVKKRLDDPELSGRKIHISAEYEASCAIYRIRDEGRGFDHENHSKRAPATTTALHGRGITLISHYMDEVSWNRSGNEVSLRKCLERRVNGELPSD
jgi:DNA-binding response OmpR family regulator